MKNLHLAVIALFALTFVSCTSKNETVKQAQWEVSILPPSVRLNPVSNQIIERSKNNYNLSSEQNLLEKNWIYNGEKVSLNSARGEYVSFQLVLTNLSSKELSDIKVDVLNFKGTQNNIEIDPELFLEWSVKVENPSTGYQKASLGAGWYPDALIPLNKIQMDSSLVHRWTYPLRIPDFNNRIPNQKSLVIWVDQYIPFEKEKAAAGKYLSEAVVSIADETKTIPLELEVWDFAIPNQNKFGAALQHEGFVSGKTEEEALKIYQLLKRNRMSVMEPTYQPLLTVKNQNASINWQDFDKRLEKYFKGTAFTKEYGYEYGPGYGEPIENFVLPFDVYGKYGTLGWPNIGKPDVERNPENINIYIDCIKQVRTHLNSMLAKDKTDLTIYLNGLDESYFKEAWSRMVYFGDLFSKYYPEAHFRIDGAYSDEAMEFVHKSIDYWGSHTINYNHEKVKGYQGMGIKDWVYGPMVYESEVNSWVGSSTFIDLPLLNDRALSWACWKYGAHSWLSWGIGAGWKHAWYDPETWKDAYKSGSGSDKDFPYKKLNGNGMLIYSDGIVPNVNVPCPSIRLKMYRNGVQEYEYLRLISELTGDKAQANKIVNDIIYEPFGENSIGNINVWSYNPEDWAEARAKLGKMINELSQKN